jgi:hypothetical protein
MRVEPGDDLSRTASRSACKNCPSAQIFAGEMAKISPENSAGRLNKRSLARFLPVLPAKQAIPPRIAPRGCCWYQNRFAIAAMHKQLDGLS